MSKLEEMLLEKESFQKTRNLKLKELSIADLKAAGEYIEKLMREHLNDIKNRDVNSENDYSYNSLKKLGFDIHEHLFYRIIKLKK